MAMNTLTNVFPALACLKKSTDERVALVSEAIVEEVLLPLGQIDFRKGQVGKCDVPLWRTRGEHKPLVGEFAFQAAKMFTTTPKACRAVLPGAAKGRQTVDRLGCTKAGMVYGLKGNEPQSHE